jgi:hypothetical protein
VESIIFNEMRCRLFTLIDDYKFFSILFEAIPAVTLIVNSLGRVRAINSVTIEKFNVSKKEAYLMKSGKVFNLGIDIAPEKFVAAVKEHNPDIVAMSALLTTTMLHMKDTIELIKEEGLKVKAIVGGAPISQDFADEIGADGFAPDAASAVELCAKLIA